MTTKLRNAKKWLEEMQFTPERIVLSYPNGEKQGLKVDTDGVNHYIYREIRNPENIHKLLDMICYGKDLKSAINCYTRSIASDVAKAYGFVKEVA